jgi:hypothetical protein
MKRMMSHGGSGLVAPGLVDGWMYVLSVLFVLSCQLEAAKEGDGSSRRDVPSMTPLSTASQ